MKKVVKDDYNISSNLRYIFQKAALIASDLKMSNVNTVSVLLAMFEDDYSVINEIYRRNAIKIELSSFMRILIESEENYQKIIGSNYPFVKHTVEDNMDLVENMKADIIEYLDVEKLEESIDEISKLLVSDMLSTIDEYIYPKYVGQKCNVPYSVNLKEAINDAGRRCRSNGKDYIDDENLLYSILNLPECSAKRFIELISDRLLIEDVKYDIIDIIGDLLNNYSIYFESFEGNIVIPKPLESCCSVLNDVYEKGVKCDILGRDSEIYHVWVSLSKKQKSNVILLGNGGVGKSSIVEAMTMSIVNGTCPEEFKNYKVIGLNVSGMVAGTKYRGDFEQKIQYLINFIHQYDNLILFVDEVHDIMGAGSTENSGMDLSGSLKTILARDKIKFIGATTMEEYKKYICKDNAFRRRFETVIVEEPKHEEVLAMLKVKIERLKKYHKVKISKKVLEYIQLCAACLNTSTCNPDKTIDLIDASMSIAKLEKSKSVTIKCVNKVFEANYKQYEKTSNEVNERTSYHESGHFVADFLNKEILVDEKNYVLSIIPGFDFLGANIFEPTQAHPRCDVEYYEARIARLVAGRIAEELFFGSKSSGASNDLGKATAIARNMITNFGLSNDSFENFSIYDDETGNSFPFSNKCVDQINKEAKEIVDRVYKSTKELLSREENKKKIEIVAKILLEKKIVSAKELEEAIEKM